MAVKNTPLGGPLGLVTMWVLAVKVNAFVQDKQVL